MSRFCSVCSETIHKNESSITISGQPAHADCDLTNLCNNEACAWHWTVHGGECVD